MSYSPCRQATTCGEVQGFGGRGREYEAKNERQHSGTETQPPAGDQEPDLRPAVSFRYEAFKYTLHCSGEMRWMAWGKEKKYFGRRVGGVGGGRPKLQHTTRKNLGTRNPTRLILRRGQGGTCRALNPVPERGPKSICHVLSPVFLGRGAKRVGQEERALGKAETPAGIGGCSRTLGRQYRRSPLRNEPSRRRQHRQRVVFSAQRKPEVAQNLPGVGSLDRRMGP